MAVTVTSKRNHTNITNATQRVIGTLTLSGTYATGGFVANLNPTGAPGTSPIPSRTLISAQFFPQTGNIYVAVTPATNPFAVTVKIFSAGTELANGTAVPDTSLPFTAEYVKFG